MASLEARSGVLQTVVRRRGLRQFVKFCIVGLSSTLVDFGVFFILIEIVHVQRFFHSQDVARALAVVLAFLFAVTNGFYWNNRWTFRAGDQPGRKNRYTKFVATNLVGLGLNMTITLLLARSTPAVVLAFLGQFLHKDPAAFFGKAVATVIVVFWNFMASKYYTFREHEPRGDQDLLNS